MGVGAGRLGLKMTTIPVSVYPHDPAIMASEQVQSSLSLSFATAVRLIKVMAIKNTIHTALRLMDALLPHLISLSFLCSSFVAGLPKPTLRCCNIAESPTCGLAALGFPNGAGSGVMKGNWSNVSLVVFW
jgi:hypothetical protein